MIYRVLGVLSLAIGGVFGIVTMLVLLPFLDNFNLSLLILAGVFAILTYVFLAIGMQLFHPPEGRDRVSGSHEQAGEAAAVSTAAASGSAGGPAASAAGAEPGALPLPVDDVPEAEPALATIAVSPPDTAGESSTTAAPVPPVVPAGAEPAVGIAAATAPVIERVLPKADPGIGGSDTESGEKPGESSNGGAPLGRPAPPRTSFKKPGSAVPRD